jgi:hypothetical protein
MVAYWQINKHLHEREGGELASPLYAVRLLEDFRFFIPIYLKEG